MVLVGLALCACVPAWADPTDPVSAAVEAVLRVSRQDQATGLGGGDKTALASILAVSRAVEKTAAGQLATTLPASLVSATLGGLEVPKATTAARIYFFVSESLGDHGLQDVLKEAIDVGPTAQVVFRGIEDGEKIQDAVRRMALEVSHLPKRPDIVIDPRLFRKYAINRVPAMATGDGAAAAVAFGLVSIDTFREWLSRGKRGDLGTFGSTMPIHEQDLIEVIKTRLERLDLNAAKTRAQRQYFETRDFVDLPWTVRPRIRTIDASVVVTRDIVAPDGAVAHAGDRINPLSLHPFRREILLFDATDARQVDWVDSIRARSPLPHLILIATEIDRRGGWTGLSMLESRFGLPVFLLTPELADRLQLAFVPAKVTADDRHFIVAEELPPERAHDIDPP
jgi:conjugal transfer pilus assembly protein TraW